MSADFANLGIYEMTPEDIALRDSHKRAEEWRAWCDDHPAWMQLDARGMTDWFVYDDEGSIVGLRVEAMGLGSFMVPLVARGSND